MSSFKENGHPPVRVGVVGLGNMGMNHVRVLSELEEADLVAVADVSEEQRSLVESTLNVSAYADYNELLAKEDLEAVVIAIPTTLHEEAVLSAIDSGIHFLVEKPIATNSDAARMLAAKAQATELVATVGHVERYNPVVMAAKRGLRAGELGRVFQLRANRTGPLPERVEDVGVVFDLATHDFDVARHLIDSQIDRVFGETAQRMHSNHEDLFSGLMRFHDGVIALFDVNWLTPVKLREMRIVGEGGMYHLDLLEQDLYFYENSHIGYWSDSFGRKGVSEGNMVKYRIERAEPLVVEHQAFLSAVRGEDSPDLVSIDDGVAAVVVAEAVQLSAQVNRAVYGVDLSSFASDPLKIDHAQGL